MICFPFLQNKYIYTLYVYSRFSYILRLYIFDQQIPLKMTFKFRIISEMDDLEMKIEDALDEMRQKMHSKGRLAKHFKEMAETKREERLLQNTKVDASLYCKPVMWFNITQILGIT